jgi:hypothetical protein
MSEAWKKAPVTLEICGTFLRWMEKQHYTEENVKYIFDQALKWHISSFNAKSSAVPEKYQPLVEEWLKKMGYRYVLRKFTFPPVVQPHGSLSFTTWWENKGVAPVYRNFRFALRLKNLKRTEVLVTDANLLTWLPGDIVYNDKVFLPYDLPEGTYELELAIISPTTNEPKVKLAIEDVNEEGWYPMGTILVQH